MACKDIDIFCQKWLMSHINEEEGKDFCFDGVYSVCLQYAPLC